MTRPEGWPGALHAICGPRTALPTCWTLAAGTAESREWGLILPMRVGSILLPYLAACALCPGTHMPAGTQLLQTLSAFKGGAGDRACMGLMVALESWPGAGIG